MQGSSVPEDVREFLLRYIDSIAHLEALLLLRREPGVAWTADSVAQRLYVSEAVAAEALQRLAGDGLVEQDGDIFRYGACALELQQMVDRVAETYARQLIPVTNLIHNKPARIRQFADAFKLRKDT